MLLLVLGLVLAAPLPAAADQDDPRLDDLFSQLRAAEGPLSAQRIEGAIWAIWIETEDPESAALMYEGMTAMRTQRLLVARAIFDALVERAPDFAEAWNKRATVQFLLGNHEDSLADIAETLKREPRHFGALSGRGLVSLALGDEIAAIAAFEAALAVHPQMPGAKANLEMLRRRNEPI